jgi:hypothetical protein
MDISTRGGMSGPTHERIVAATSANLRAMVQTKEFREILEVPLAELDDALDARRSTPVFRMKKPAIEPPGDAGEEPDIIATARLLS